MAAARRRGRGFERGKCYSAAAAAALRGPEQPCGPTPSRGPGPGTRDRGSRLEGGPAAPRLLPPEMGRLGIHTGQRQRLEVPGLPCNLLVIWRGGNFLSRACQWERFSKFPPRGSLRFYIMTSACRALAPLGPATRRPAPGQGAPLSAPAGPGHGWSGPPPTPTRAPARLSGVRSRRGTARPGEGPRAQPWSPGPAPARAGGA